MFASLFKQKNSDKKHVQEVAASLYSGVLKNIRDEVFYTKYNVPDSFDGRFDLLVLHVFLILNRIIDQDNYSEISQALFDEMFKDMDQTLREMGIGDVGVPKHMKRMMLAFNGRMHSYQNAVDGDGDLGEALSRNLYGIKDIANNNDDSNEKDIAKNMCDFVYNNLRCNSGDDIKGLLSGKARFVNLMPNSN